ncbi:polysaccharide pyruvyl transferase family protein [Pseudonocardia sp. RS010]|uniref:polysaccharide pyruvyl transferase family protein n=1 Tax=Pseudonocardia sp. RS010 TaxID=3385979 RepID=UPI0039A3D86F
MPGVRPLAVRLTRRGRAVVRTALTGVSHPIPAPPSEGSGAASDAAPPALTTSCDLAWVERDYATSAAFAREVLALHPADAEATARLHRAVTAPAEYRSPTDPRHPVLAHVAFFVTGQGNFGDIALPLAVRAAFERSAGPLEWSPVHAHHVVDDEVVERINATSGLVVGGGGLILPDTAPNGSSGWQWNATVEALRRITVPIALHAVGFNLFRGQRIDHPRFRDHIVALAERSEVLGFRNTGSVERVRDLLPERLRDRVRLSPCPTTVLCRLVDLPAAPPAEVPRVLLNMAFDRAERRFGSGYPAFLDQMADAAGQMRRRGWEVAYAAHLPVDERFVHDLERAHGLHLEVERLYAGSVDDAYRTYRGAAAVVGMRGHATMIPFGLGVPVVSLVSHDKMWFFLDDIGHRDWGLEVGDPDLAARLLELVADRVAHADRYRADTALAQDGLLREVDARAGELLAAVRPAR